ncbi:MAG: hypothetical protein COT28_16910 [Methylobacterium sp. CG08_land_8_20_14_0_20_71_15]|nr:MAG: hypothetical protein COT56_08790 [Methylobacterium sp. CG09_land_8_20_14_0_10_71_15]PIU12128.1 MAG: hypothetical protein COT28_16910 [Methylobacterium sp. CG08_land_8_20_14_0_20_71_15]
MLDEVGDRSRQLRDAEIRRLLGLWVSECEPQLVHGPNGIAGLALAGDRTYEGPMPIIVPAETIEIALTCGDAVWGTHPVAMSLEECRRREEAAAKRPLHPWSWA